MKKRTIMVVGATIALAVSGSALMPGAQPAAAGFLNCDCRLSGHFTIPFL